MPTRPEPEAKSSTVLPRTAELAGDFSVLRSVTSKEGDHSRATYNVKTGYRPFPNLVHPSIGSIICHSLPGPDGAVLDLPSHISILPGGFPARGGYLGARYDSFQTGDPVQPIPDVRPLASGERQQQRLDSLAILEKSFAKGAYICHKGDKLDPWLGVVSGLVRLGTVSQKGKTVTLAGMRAGIWFGEGSVLKKEPRQYDLVALRDVRLAMMPSATFFWLFENSAGFNRFLVKQFNERIGQFIALVEFDRSLDATGKAKKYVAQRS